MTDFAAIDFEIANREPSSVCSVGVINEFHCTCRTSRSVFGKTLPNHKLPIVATHCGYDLTKHHHALADAEACAVIAMKIL